MLDFSINKYYTINDLVNIMQILRGENGCPWDKDQTHSSIRNNFIEEVYEVIEAIDTDNTELLREELETYYYRSFFTLKWKPNKIISPLMM